jgi:hypothetical protein
MKCPYNNVICCVLVQRKREREREEKKKRETESEEKRMREWMDEVVLILKSRPSHLVAEQMCL